MDLQAPPGEFLVEVDTGRGLPAGCFTAERLKALARSRGLSMNKLVEELSAQALSAWDTENHFRVLAATGDVQGALAILDRLDDDERLGANTE